MDFTPWSPTHAILVLFAIVAFVGHVAIMFYRIGQNAKKIDQFPIVANRFPTCGCVPARRLGNLRYDERQFKKS